jgi:hypothetical protein
MNINRRARIIHIPQYIALLPVSAAITFTYAARAWAHRPSALQSRTRLTPARDSALGTSRLRCARTTACE